MAIQVGGSFAPPLDEAKLVAFESLIPSNDRQVADYMTSLIAMVRKFQETPTSKRPGTPHSVVGTIIPLEDAEVQRIWDVVPYHEECDAIGKVFDRLPTGDLRNFLNSCGIGMQQMYQNAAIMWGRANLTGDKLAELELRCRQKATRDAAYHLLWYARELTNDREPITTDKL